MAKGNSGKFKQDAVLSQFQRDIRSEASRTWLNATEQAILKGKQLRERAEKTKKEEPVRISHYNPNNPLNRSGSWNREQRAEYAAQQKAIAKANKK